MSRSNRARPGVRAALPALSLLMASLALAGCGKRGEETPASTEPRTPAETPTSSSAARLPAAIALPASARSGESADGTYAVRWEVVGGAIPDAEPFEVAFSVRRADGRPVAADAEVFVDAEMPHHGHGMSFVPSVERHADDTFVAKGLLFHMPGRWVLAIDVGEDGVRERTQWYVDVE